MKIVIASLPATVRNAVHHAATLAPSSASVVTKFRALGYADGQLRGWANTLDVFPVGVSELLDTLLDIDGRMDTNTGEIDERTCKLCRAITEACNEVIYG